MTSSSAQTPVGRLPNFLVIGAMKGGTTSLYHYLGAHPQVYVPPYKAPEFFVEASNWWRGLDWYRKQFAGAGPDAVAIGEVSNAYTKYPQSPGVPQRIANYIPEVRLIYVVRDPIQRIRSHYQTRFREGSEIAPLEQAVFENAIYLDHSQYALQIEQYMGYFSRDQLLVITSEELRDRRHATMRRLYGFLGVDDAFVPPNLDRDFYQTSDMPAHSLVPLGVRKWLKTHVPATKRAKELEANILRTLNRRRRSPAAAPTTSVVVSDEVRAALEAALVDDVRRLRGFLGPDFDGWGIG
jgi:sulfotransferase family protein